MLIDVKEWTVVAVEVSPEGISTLTLHPLGRLFGAIMLEVMAGVEEAKVLPPALSHAERRREKKRRRRVAVAAAGADLAFAAGGKPPDEVE